MPVVTGSMMHAQRLVCNALGASHSSGQRPLPPLHAVRRRVHSQVTSFPGDDAPGTGSRRFPDEQPDCRDCPPASRPLEAPERFSMKTTQECYEEFPAQVRASFPLYVREHPDPQPAGVAAQHIQDNGPTTGHRRPPPPVDPLGPARRRPLHSERPEDLRREVALRKGC